MDKASDALSTYRDKRDFSKTAEPNGDADVASDSSAPRFVVQKHDATRLHYDVRFEVDGVMPSWAVPKGPSYDPSQKRLAVQTEDHPLDYQDFEGIIPAGEYGGGGVIIWDAGTYESMNKGRTMREAIERGHFSVAFHGQKLRGAWALTRTGGRNWIMVKRKDDDANPSLDIVNDAPESVVSGRTIEEVESDEDAREWTRGIATFAPPMLADLSDRPVSGAGWLLERKFDGLRCVVVRNGDDVQLWSRNHLPFTPRFPDIVDAVRSLPVDNLVLDGEIVAIDPGDRTSFSLLQRGGAAVVPQLFVFDLLHLLGQDVRHLTLLQRKELLSRIDLDSPTVHLVEPLEGDAQTLLAHACANGWEGLIAKRVDSTYVAGRSSAWKKLKCTASQEMVIGGWTNPKGTRVGFGALLLGYYDDGDLRYAGKVGTGFDVSLLRELHAQLETREIDRSPFVDVVREKGAHWASPDLVANITFSEWTRDGKLRHARFVALRPDKRPREVIREQ